jgi:hydroxymethylbilane synthase
MSAPDRIVIASRASTLALWQSRHVQSRLRDLYPACDVSILGMSTRGDRILDRSLAKIGGKGLFVKELENALATGEAQIAVHSMKDVPMELPPGFSIGAILAREDPRDAFVSNRYPSLDAMPGGARVGTSSLRREAQLRARFPALDVRPLRGNVQTRLKKLDAGEFDAVILATAGLKRLDLDARITAVLSTEHNLPAPGQGALGIECLQVRQDLIDAVDPLGDPQTTQAVRAERAVSRALGGSCQLPLGAYAVVQSGTLRLRACIATPDGRTFLTAESSGQPDAPEALGDAVAALLRVQGADAIVASMDALRGPAP